MTAGEVTITDVGPRDGLQSQAKILAPEQRVELVEALVEAGVRQVEVGAFVSEKAVPAMAGSGAVLAGLRSSGCDAAFSVLVPNIRGYERAREAGAERVCLVLYGSEGMAQANVRMSRGQAEASATEILRRARADGVRVTSTIAVAFDCPYDGPVDPSGVCDLAGRMLDRGTDELSVADTIGAADPGRVRSLAETLVSQFGAERLSGHFHDTRAMGLANVYAALEAGIRRFDASIAGLGGCPFAPGASGNVATEDVVMMVEQMGYRTGIDQAALMHASDRARKLTGTAPGGRASAWLKRRYGQSSGPEAAS